MTCFKKFLGVQNKQGHGVTEHKLKDGFLLHWRHLIVGFPLKEKEMYISQPQL